MSRSRTLAIAAVLAALALTAGALVLRHRAGPEYALRQGVAAAAAGDLERAERFIDVSALAVSVADDWVAARVRAGRGSQPATSASLDSLERAVAAEARRLEAGFRAGAPASAPLGTLVEATRLRRATLGEVRVTRQGAELATARISVVYAYLDTVFHLDAAVQANGGRWRVTAVRGTEELSRAVRNAEARRLAEINRPVDSALGGLIRIDAPTFAADTTTAPVPAWVEATVPVWNVGRQPITGLQLRLAPDAEPAAALLVELAPADTLMPGSMARLTGRIAGDDVRLFLPVFTGRDELSATVTRGVLGTGAAARRYRAVPGWSTRP